MSRRMSYQADSAWLQDAVHLGQAFHLSGKVMAVAADRQGQVVVREGQVQRRPP